MNRKLKRCLILGIALIASLISTQAFASQVSKQEITRILTTTVYNESRGESVDGQLQVLLVMEERTKHAEWPSSIVKVALQKHGTICQFTSWCNKHSHKIEKAAWSQAQIEVHEVLSGQVVDNMHATCYDSVPHPKWGKLLGTIGRHYFYDCVSKSHDKSPNTIQVNAGSDLPTLIASKSVLPTLILDLEASCSPSAGFPSLV